jgi:iron complex outermembrane receptor protein
MYNSTLLRGVSVGAILLAISTVRLQAQETLPTIDIGNDEKRQGDTGSAPGFDAKRVKEPIYRDPPGQTVTTVDHKFLESTPMFTVREMLQYSPGVSLQQGNTPRDLVISIRGSANRVFAGVRNIMMYEDGFPIMTSDGNGRTDILDPHAFSAIDVYRGPSSAMFGNYAYGGAINYRSFSGAQINGFEVGSEFGSFGYFNDYIRAGAAVSDKNIGDFDASLFASRASADNFIDHNAYEVGLAKALFKWSPTPSDRFVLKGLYADNFAELQLRLSQAQFYYNPFQNGCRIAGSPICVNTTQPANGFFGPPFAPLATQSTSQLGQHAHTNRVVSGARWEHDFDNATTWRTQFTYDHLDILSATTPPVRAMGPVSNKGPTVGIAVSTDVTNHGMLFGRPATHFLGFFYDNVRINNNSTTWLPNAWNYGVSGAPQNKVDSFQSNIGLKAREEIALTDNLTATIGFSSNWAKVSGTNTIYNYTVARVPTTPSYQTADAAYWNTAPEAALTYRYSPEWQFRARYGVGYGTPNFSWLTTTSTGVGNNTTLKPQTNMGVDVGIDWTPNDSLTFSITGFNEWFRNETLVQISPSGFGYYTGVPSSIHRGFEANVDWRPLPGWRFIAAYTFNDQFFTKFSDALSSTVSYDRSGNRIPNVPAHNLTTRIGYDQPDGDLKGLGAYVEYVFKSAYTIDNANLTSIPGYGLVNLNIHYNRDLAISYFKNIELFFDIRNLFDRTYVAGAGVMTNTLIAGTAIQTPATGLSTNTTSGIIAGSPRAFIGGVKFKF